MTEQQPKRDGYVWSLALWGAVAAVAVAAPTIIATDNIVLEIFFVLPVVALGFLIALGVAVRAAWSRRLRRSLSILLMLVVFCLVVLTLVRYDFQLRATGRWALWSRQFKSRLEAQPQPLGGELRHIIWDSWGFVGIDTDVFLVFDPQDSLRNAAKTRPGKLAGIPCPPYAVKRLEANWYAVTFFTEQSWNVCPYIDGQSPLRN